MAKSKQIPSEDEPPKLDRREHLKSQKRLSSRRNNSNRSKPSSWHLDDSGGHRSERQLTREASSRRQHKSNSNHRSNSHHSDIDYNHDDRYRIDRQNEMDGQRSGNDEQDEIGHPPRRSNRRSGSRQQRSRSRRSLSEHKEDSRRSGMGKHRSIRRLDEQSRGQSVPPILPAASSQTQATSQFSDLESHPHQFKTKKRKSKRAQRRSILSTRNVCCGCFFIVIIIAVIVTVILLQKRVVNPATLPTFDPPSSADCAAISKGTYVTPKEGAASTISIPRRFQINLQVEMKPGTEDFSNAELLSSVKDSLQTHLMPILADCPEMSTRRLLGEIFPVNRQILTLGEALPQYIISNGVVVNAIMNPNAVSSGRYLLLVIIDVWLHDEAQDGLVINKVLEAFEKIDQGSIFPSQVQIVESAMIVQPMSTLDGVTVFPTVPPTVVASMTPTEVPTLDTSSSPTNVQSLYPSVFPSVASSVAPSGLPSVSPSRVPSSEPSQHPSTKPSLKPTLVPTSKPTEEPNLSPTSPPPTVAATKLPVSVDRSVDVVIVGAGAAGITAAYHLEQQGLSVVLLEAANRYGGRMKQDNTWDVSLGLGPEWLHVDDPNDMLSGIVGRTVNKRVIEDPRVAHRWTGNTLEYDPPGRWSGDYRWMDGTWWDFFDQELASNLQSDTIVLNSLVQKIDYEYQKPVVFLTNGSRYEGSYVIVTASVRTLQLGEIDFVPSLPEDHLGAIDNIEMDITVKVFLEFTEKFYPDAFALESDGDDYSSDCNSSRHGLRLFYDPTVGRVTSTNILGMFTYADIADLYTGQSESEVIQTLLAVLDEIFDGKASQTFVKGVVQDWANEPQIRTAYTRYGSSRYRGKLREPIDNKLYFAGESVRNSGASWGYVHGAAYCGKDVAEEISDRMRR